MEILQVQNPPEHGYIIIAVPSEKIESKTSDIKKLVSKNGTNYRVVDRVTCSRSEMLPSAMIILATGQSIPDSEIWAKYKNSDKLIFFICSKEC